MLEWLTETSSYQRLDRTRTRVDRPRVRPHGVGSKDDLLSLTFFRCEDLERFGCRSRGLGPM